MPKERAGAVMLFFVLPFIMGVVLGVRSESQLVLFRPFIAALILAVTVISLEGWEANKYTLQYITSITFATIASTFNFGIMRMILTEGVVIALNYIVIKSVKF